MTVNKHNTLLVLLVLAAFLIFGVGIFVGSFFSKETPKVSQPVACQNDNSNTEIHENIGKLTNPLLLCDTSTHIETGEFKIFEQKLYAVVDTLISEHKVDHVAIYFRKLLDGAWFGTNEKEIFTPASLLKVPTMLAIFKQADSDPTILNDKLRYTKVYFLDKPHFEPEQKLEIGKEYTVDELITRMVKYSDNESLFLLRDKFDPKIFEDVYRDLKMLPPNDSISNDFMTIRSYATFFRVLFNTSYLSVAMSEKALEILTNTSFNVGITKGVPPDVQVAHKFGERTYTDDNSKQLHDCGIIYFPNDPYLLCVMTKGQDFDSLASVLAEISKDVWNEMKLRSKDMP